MRLYQYIKKTESCRVENLTGTLEFFEPRRCINAYE